MYHINPIYRRIINNKLNSITSEELLMYAHKYNVALTPKQANIIIRHLRKERIDIGNEQQVNRIINELERKTGVKVRMILKQILKQYNIDIL